MKRTLALCAVVVAMVGGRSTPLSAAGLNARAYALTMAVYEAAGEAKQRTVAERVMVVREGESFSYEAPGESPAAVGKSADAEIAPSGLQAKFLVRQPAADKLSVSLSIGNDALGYEKNGDVTIRQTGVRCVRTVRPGETIYLDIGGGREAQVVILPIGTGN